MKKILLVIFLLLSGVYSHANSLKLSKRDINVLKKIRQLHPDVMYKYTLMALAFKESSAGKYLVNHKSKDYGIFQANIRTVLSRAKVKDTPANRKKFSKKLVNDTSFAIKNALAEIKYWQKVHKRDWFNTWASYNTGWRYESKTGVNYALSIYDIIKKLRFEYKL